MSLPKSKTNKKWKEKWNWLKFSEKQTERKHQEKLKRMPGFTEALKGSDNFKTFDLSNHDKSKMHVQAINEDKYIRSTKHGQH